ncbi:unnamed protein product [Heterobilharzia americana]|nr:unnamed protein product [Heterobilharzia americana]
MGLATTITAAALGSTGFRTNRMLDYLSASKSTLHQKIPHDLIEKNNDSIVSKSYLNRGSVDSNKPSTKCKSLNAKCDGDDAVSTHRNSTDKLQTRSSKPNPVTNAIDVEVVHF